MSYFPYNNKACYYEERGSGTPLLLLHGNTASSVMFSGAAEAFAHDYRVILLDFAGHGKSERVEELSVDLWYDEAMQAIALLEHLSCQKANLIGSSGGALVAINVALERPDLVGKVIADSFEGEAPLAAFTQNIAAERAASKRDPGACAFYRAMHGDDWERIVDQDTKAIHEHARLKKMFFHKPLSGLRPPILFTGSLEDEFIRLIDPDFFRTVYTELIAKIGHGKMHLFKTGGHPAMLSNQEEFIQRAKEFLNDY